MTADQPTPEELELMRKVAAESKAWKTKRRKEVAELKERKQANEEIFAEVCTKCHNTIPVPSEIQQKMADFLEKGSSKGGTEEFYLQSEWMKQKSTEGRRSVEFKIVCPNPDCRAVHIIRLSTEG